MVDVCRVFEYAAYPFSTKTLLAATIESQLSAIKYFQLSFEIDATDPGIAGTLKGAARSHADAGTKQPCAGLCHG